MSPRLTMAHRTLEGPGPCPWPTLEGLASSWETAGTARGGGAHPREPPSAMAPAPCQRPVQRPRPGRAGWGRGQTQPPCRRDTVRAGLSTAPPGGCPGRVGSSGSGIEPAFPALAGRFLTAEPPGKPRDLQLCLDTGPGWGWRVTAWLYLQFFEESPDRCGQRLHQSTFPLMV